MRKFGITSLYVLAIIQKHPEDACISGVAGYLARATDRKEMPQGQTALAIRRLKKRRMVIRRKGPATTGRRVFYYALTPKGENVLKEIREFIT